jgi:hypothetical protein
MMHSTQSYYSNQRIDGHLTLQSTESDRRESLEDDENRSVAATLLPISNGEDELLRLRTFFSETLFSSFDDFFFFFLLFVLSRVLSPSNELDRDLDDEFFWLFSFLEESSNVTSNLGGLFPIKILDDLLLVCTRSLVGVLSLTDH